MTTSVCLLGASGSVGESTLKVLRAYPEKFRLHSFSVHSNLEKAKEIQKEFSPDFICVSSNFADVGVLGNKLGRTQILYGESALCELVREPEVEIVITAVVGSVGLRPTIAAITSGKKLGIANKETLVTSGPLIQSLITKHNTKVVPVDSEHNALFQLFGIFKSKLCGKDHSYRFWRCVSGFACRTTFLCHKGTSASSSYLEHGS